MTDQQTAELKQLPLATLHRDAGSPMMGLCGWEVPAHYGDPEGEYKAASNTIALLDASFLTKVHATGSDHVEYLNRRLSQRIIESEPGTVLRANQLSGDGRMEADLEVLRLAENESLLLAPPAVGGGYLQAVADKYVFTEDATFTDETHRWASLALVGPKGTEILRALNLPMPTVGQATEGTLGGITVKLFVSEFFFGSVILLFDVEDASSAWKSLREAVEKAGGRPLGFLAFDTLRVEHGTPWWGIDLTERSIPLEADLMTAIHTN
ncbi:MAG: aminomethyltransferase family protein, partial [Candidatus Sumerlaeia bacterium]|nr:aminomethyltransferase family protein [Candidatus Sumerlaeia bacterium]